MYLFCCSFELFLWKQFPGVELLGQKIQIFLWFSVSVAKSAPSFLPSLKVHCTWWVQIVSSARCAGKGVWAESNPGRLGQHRSLSSQVLLWVLLPQQGGAGEGRKGLWAPWEMKQQSGTSCWTAADGGKLHTSEREAEQSEQDPYPPVKDGDRPWVFGMASRELWACS